MFATLNDKFENIISSLKGKAVINEDDLDVTLREIRIALLEADVALIVVKTFIENIKKDILGKEILKKINPDQMIIKLVYDELVRTLGSSNESPDYNDSGLTKFLFCGLQGSGKTTTVSKFANYIKNNTRKKILLASADIYRPAAQEQLEVLSKQTEVSFFKIDSINNVNEIIQKSTEYALKNLFDVLIIDTAGRQVIDLKMMEELKLISENLNPDETILVADALTGQDAANVAKKFNDSISINSTILTRVDGDSRGGAALSIKLITGAPIKFIGTGEKIENFEVFYPDRIANRILGMGDIVSLVEKASDQIDKDEMQNLAEKMSKGNFDLEDFSKQLKQMNKMGGVSGILSMLPGISKTQKLMAENNISEDMVSKQIAIISSMTKKEKKEPDIIKASRKIRISKGSGTRVQDINKLLKQFFQSQKMMKKMKSLGNKGIPTDLLNKLKGNLPKNFNN